MYFRDHGKSVKGFTSKADKPAMEQTENSPCLKSVLPKTQYVGTPSASFFLCKACYSILEQAPHTVVQDLYHCCPSFSFHWHAEKTTAWTVFVASSSISVSRVSDVVLLLSGSGGSQEKIISLVNVRTAEGLGVSWISGQNLRHGLQTIRSSHSREQLTLNVQPGVPNFRHDRAKLTG